MIIKEQNKINGIPYVRITSDQENHFVKVKGSDNEPTNEIMIKGENCELEFEEILIEEESTEIDIENEEN